MKNAWILVLALLLCVPLVACDSDPTKPKDETPPTDQTEFVRVNGVELHYIDWGGEGPAILFLTGMGNSAHIYDDIAPLFTVDHRVLALTRRGHGQSEKPGTGYDTGTLVEDVRAFLDHFELNRVTLVGHSLAGDELTRFATVYPERVEKLIYLDAAIDRADLLTVTEAAPYEQPVPGPEDVVTLDAFRDWLIENNYGFWSPALETELRLQAAGHFTPPAITLALFEGSAQANPDYTKVLAPALSIYAVVQLEDIMPADADPALAAATEQYYNELLAPYFERERNRFRNEVASAQVVEMPGAHHYVFIDEEEAVVQLMKDFLAERRR